MQSVFERANMDKLSNTHSLHFPCDDSSLYERQPKSREVYTYLSVATKWQVYGQAEEVVHEVLEGGEQVLHLLL